MNEPLASAAGNALEVHERRRLPHRRATATRACTRWSVALGGEMLLLGGLADEHRGRLGADRRRPRLRPGGRAFRAHGRGARRAGRSRSSAPAPTCRRAPVVRPVPAAAARLRHAPSTRAAVGVAVVRARRRAARGRRTASTTPSASPRSPGSAIAVGPDAPLGIVHARTTRQRAMPRQRRLRAAYAVGRGCRDRPGRARPLRRAERAARSHETGDGMTDPGSAARAGRRRLGRAPPARAARPRDRGARRAFRPPRRPLCRRVEASARLARRPAQPRGDLLARRRRRSPAHRRPAARRADPARGRPRPHRPHERVRRAALPDDPAPARRATCASSASASGRTTTTSPRRARRPRRHHGARRAGRGCRRASCG